MKTRGNGDDSGYEKQGLNETKSGPSRFCGRQQLKYLLSPVLNILPQIMVLLRKGYFFVIYEF